MSDKRAGDDFNDRRIWGPEPRYPRVRAYPEEPNAGSTIESGPRLIILAGPCSIESVEHAERSAQAVAAAGRAITSNPLELWLRGGVYRAGTYPPKKDFGLQRLLLRGMSAAARRHKMGNVVEVLDVRQVDEIEPHAAAFQVGARHMQDYALLRELAQSTKTVFLKRAPGATLDEFMGAAEYLAAGRCRPVLIERGSSTHMNHVRWDLSVSLIAAVKRLTGIPILVDASHGTGRRDLVAPMIMAGLAAGADGFLVEVHANPDKSLSDADQAFPESDLKTLFYKAGKLAYFRPNCL